MDFDYRKGGPADSFGKSQLAEQGHAPGRTRPAPAENGPAYGWPMPRSPVPSLVFNCDLNANAVRSKDDIKPSHFCLNLSCPSPKDPLTKISVLPDMRT